MAVYANGPKSGTRRRRFFSVLLLTGRNGGASAVCVRRVQSERFPAPLHYFRISCNQGKGVFWRRGRGLASPPPPRLLLTVHLKRRRRRLSACDHPELFTSGCHTLKSDSAATSLHFLFPRRLGFLLSVTAVRRGGRERGGGGGHSSSVSSPGFPLMPAVSRDETERRFGGLLEKPEHSPPSAATLKVKLRSESRGCCRRKHRPPSASRGLGGGEESSSAHFAAETTASHRRTLSPE